MNYWLVKTEPNKYSIDDLKKDKTTAWDEVRNYQARNFLTSMKKGDQVIVYHSNAKPPGIVGLATVTKEAYPDELQFDKKSNYFDPKATKESPRWFSPDLKFKKKFAELVPLDDLRGEKKLANMKLLQKGSRLSVIPVTEAEFDHVLKIAS
ncbi:UNVERIFIED_CONTAM: hypothetical protein GTU68_014156 [Idotea baltica]|nr:hypothetical protein [Idotea baltica]